MEQWTVFLTFSLLGMACGDTVYEALGRDTALRKFYELVSRDEVLKLVLTQRTGTVFAPDNAAVERAPKWIWNYEDKIANFHVCNLLAKLDMSIKSLSSYEAGAPPIFLNSKHNEETGELEHFINNAKIKRFGSFKSTEGNEQLLYVIDQMLEPYLPQDNLPPNALSFMKQPSIYRLKETFSAFASRVRSEKQEELFSRVGFHTFFLPIGAAEGKNLNRLQDIDEWVIRGHVIPNHVLFTRTMGSKPFHSESFANNLKVEVSLVNQTNEFSDSDLLFVQSNTIQSDQKHRKGVVLSKIVRGNIPVANGVVHLINSPLMIIDITIWSFIEIEKEGRLSRLSQLIQLSPDFRREIQSTKEKTLFAPTDDAILKLPPREYERLKNDSHRLTELLKLHLVMKSISSEDVYMGRIKEYMCSDNKRSLYFGVVGDARNRTLTVEGSGVNATAVQADVGATNGIIHIIDRVLGMPYQTVYEKLKSDPELRTSFELGQQSDWNWMLNDRSRRFTFFVPSEKAWETLKLEHPTEHKQLTMKLFPYHVRKILSRHLKVGDALLVQDLEKNATLEMVQGTFKFKMAYKYGGLQVMWEDLVATISRPDVQATNGVIHVIDKVLMKRRDMTKTSGASQVTAGLTFLLFVSAASFMV